MKTITRADVAEILYQEVGLSRKDSGEILDMVWKKSSMNWLPAATSSCLLSERLP